jgi:hypothetical protein
MLTGLGCGPVIMAAFVVTDALGAPTHPRAPGRTVGSSTVLILGFAPAVLTIKPVWQVSPTAPAIAYGDTPFDQLLALAHTAFFERSL